MKPGSKMSEKTRRNREAIDALRTMLGMRPLYDYYSPPDWLSWIMGPATAYGIYRDGGRSRTRKNRSE